MGKKIIKKIFQDHWKGFVKLYGYKIRKVVFKEVEKMINCGSLSKGYLEFKCAACGEKKKVGFRCRSRFCTSCGKVYVDERAENMASKLINSRHRHMVFTIPEELRNIFQKDRKLLAILAKCAAEVLISWFNEQNKKEKYTPGIVAVIHTFGRDLKWNPHVHILVTEGGAGEKTVWKKFKFIPYKMLRKRWQKILLDGIEKKIGKRKFKGLKNKLYKKLGEGFYVYGKGIVKNETAAIMYVGRYTGRPVMSESRIIDYDGETVTYYYERHEDGKRIEEKIDVYEFIKKLIIHIPEEQFKMIRYYGIYARNTKPRKKLIKMVSEKIKQTREKMRNWRIRIMKTFGYDPIECKTCGNTMELIDVYSRRYGSLIERYRMKILEQAKKEIEETEEIYRTIKRVTEGEMEPIFA